MYKNNRVSGQILMRCPDSVTWRQSNITWILISDKEAAIIKTVMAMVYDDDSEGACIYSVTKNV
jgi:hypothetical protein